MRVMNRKEADPEQQEGARSEGRGKGTNSTPTGQPLCIMPTSNPIRPILLIGRARAGKLLRRVPRVARPQALPESVFRCTP